jgi:multiple sugar transport system ATP-binding protein
MGPRATALPQNEKKIGGRMATVSVENVSKNFGEVVVLRDVSVDVADGEFAVLVGPSGCGKSTLLRIVAGLENVSRGVVRIGEGVVNNVRPKDRDIAMVFQNYALYPHMNVAANMAFSLKQRRVPREQIDAEVRQAAEILSLTPLLSRYPRQLSGGQRQRVAMGRAIVRDPKVFLFDEPLSNLDANLRVQMRTEIKELHQRLRTTTIYVTHDQIEAMTLADKIVVMRGGTIEQIGAPLTLYDRPANVFVAQFIGSPSMNILSGRLQGDAFTTEDGISIPVGRTVATDGTPELAHLGIRPEHVALTGAGGIPATVHVVELTGPETQIFARVGSKTVVAAFHERVVAKPGDRIFLRFPSECLHLFGGPGGSRLPDLELA